MTAATIIRAALADGVALALSDAGTVKATGASEAVNRWLATIRENKAGLIEALRYAPAENNQRKSKPVLVVDNAARFMWLMHFTDRDPILSSFWPEVTHAEALASYPDAVAAEPYEPPPPTLEPMTADEEEVIAGWLEYIGETDPATIGETIRQCQKDPEARRYFLDRAEEMPATDDDRRTCQQCANLMGERCQAAKRGEIVAPRSYAPIRDIPRRCEGYAPKKGEPDQRSGKERWPGL